MSEMSPQWACNTLPVLNFRLLCSGFTCHVFLRLFSSLCWEWCYRRKVSLSKAWGTSPLSLFPTSPPRDEDLVSWHGPLAAGLAFWLWTIFCNWAGEGCLCFCLGLRLPEPAAPPPPRLQIVPPAPGTLPCDRPLFHPVLCCHLHSTTFSRHRAVTTHSLAHPPRLSHSRARKQEILYEQRHVKQQATEGKKKKAISAFPCIPIMLFFFF